MERLTEIRQRTEAAKAQKEKGDSITAACIAWSIVANDIPYLLSEVDRLNALHKREIIITGEYAQRVIDLTARAEKAEAENRWIPVGERLPEDSEPVYVYCPTGRGSVEATMGMMARAHKYTWYTHWMPRAVPEPPKVEIE